MPQAIRRTSLLPRTSFVRDASLFIVATEGPNTEAAYLNLFRSSRLKIVPIPVSERNESAPQYVIGRMNTYLQENRIEWQADDQCWLMLDVDRWKLHTLAEVCREAEQRHYRLAVSNPCLELWLMMHFTDIDPALDTNCKAIDKRLTVVMGGQSKNYCNPALYNPESMRAAIERAKNLPDTRPAGQRWPNFPGTDLWHLVTEFLVRLPVTT